MVHNFHEPRENTGNQFASFTSDSGGNSVFTSWSPLVGYAEMAGPAINFILWIYGLNWLHYKEQQKTISHFRRFFQKYLKSIIGPISLIENQKIKIPSYRKK